MTSLSDPAATATNGELPSLLGRFEIRRRLGSGAFATVFAAYDPSLDREIALKIIARGENMEDASATRGESRLLHEARLLGRLRHPNVVTVHEVGEQDGCEFIAMELVAGRTLRAWAPGRPWRAILDVFLQVGDGLIAVHDAELVHRDVKPDNIVVDERGRACLVDFGLATAATTRSRGSGRETVAGTPAYMAPEQLDGNQAGPASDQFSFCIALYEAVYGRRPFVGATLEELRRAIQTGPSDDAASQTVPKWLRSALWRGLSPAPAQRWSSMRELHNALRSGLEQRGRRWRRAGMLACAVGLLVFELFYRTTGSERCDAPARAHEIWNSDRAQVLARSFAQSGLAYAETSWSAIARRVDAYESGWTEAYEDACQAAQAEDHTEAAKARLQLACLDEAHLRLKAALDVLERADPTTIENSAAIVASLPSPASCAYAGPATIAASSATPTEPIANALRERLARAEVEVSAGHPKLALAELDRIAGELQGDDHPAVALEASILRAAAEVRLTNYANARTMLDEAFAEAVRAGRWNAAVRALTVRIALAADSLEAMEGAEEIARIGSALATRDEVTTQRSEDLEASRAVLLLSLGKPQEAATIFRRLLETGGGRESPDLISQHNNLSIALRQMGELSGAEREARAGLQGAIEVLGARHPEVGRLQGALANVLFSRGAYDDAIAQMRAGTEVLEHALGPEHTDVAIARSNLGVFLSERGDHASAAVEHERALSAVSTSLGPDHPRSIPMRANLAFAYGKLGHPDLAEFHARRAVTAATEHLGERHVGTANTRMTLADVLIDLERFEDAVTELEIAIDIFETDLGPDDSNLLYAYQHLANAYSRLRRSSEALEASERAWRVAQRGKHFERGNVALNRAKLLWKTGRHRAEAIELAREAVGAFEAAGSSFEGQRRVARAWLEERLASRRPAFSP